MPSLATQLQPIASRRVTLASALVLASVFVGPRPASANTPEDVFGVGARNNAMGGAATAAVRDFTAVYYNPGALARCRGNHLSVSAQHVAYGALDIDIPEGSRPMVPDPDQPGQQMIDPDYVADPPRDQTRITVGFCNRLPFDLAIGALVAFNLQNPLLLDLSTQSPEPQWGVFDEPTLQIALNLGLGWAPNDVISFGAGFSLLLRSELVVRADFVLGGESAALLRYNLNPAFAGYLGVLITPNERVSIGVTYRSKLTHQVTLPVTASILNQDALINITGENWHSPHQLALGVSADPTARLTLAADVTWYRWSGYGGPFLAAPTEGELALEFPEVEDVGYRDVVVPRIGAEWRPTVRSALRWGYAFRASAVARPGTSSGCREQADAGEPCIGNVLDSHTHSISIGGGYRFGVLTEPEATTPDAKRVFAQLDAFLRYTRVQPRNVNRTEPEDQLPHLRRYSFGGSLFEAGLTVSLGWY